MTPDIEKLIHTLREMCVDFDGSQIVDGASPRYEPDCGILRQAADALASLVRGMDEVQAMFYWPDAKRRLWFISDRIAKGGLNRSDLCQAFGISVPQASADIGRWMEMHPGAALYDKRAKRYVPTLSRAALP